MNSPRLTVETVREMAWAKGWDFFASARRGRRYQARPAWHAMFTREQPTWVFGDLADAFRWLTHSAPEPIASRVDYDLIRWNRRRLAGKAAA